jgi:hypothetical protein
MNNDHMPEDLLLPLPPEAAIRHAAAEMYGLSGDEAEAGWERQRKKFVEIITQQSAQDLSKQLDNELDSFARRGMPANQLAARRAAGLATINLRILTAANQSVAAALERLIVMMGR